MRGYRLFTRYTTCDAPEGFWVFWGVESYSKLGQIRPNTPKNTQNPPKLLSLYHPPPRNSSRKSVSGTRPLEVERCVQHEAPQNLSRSPHGRMGVRDEVVRDNGVIPPSQSLLSLHRDIALLKQLSVPTEPRARASWPTGRQSRQSLSRSNTANTMGSSGFSDSWPPGSPMTEADTHLPLGTPMRPDTVTSVYRSSFDLFPGRPPAVPLVMRSTEEAEEAVYAARVLKSASMPYLYRPVTAMQRFGRGDSRWRAPTKTERSPRGGGAEWEG
jgi:hypothetical protein